MTATTEAPWRQRFRAARVMLPGWARDAPERLLYASNATGKWELYAWDRAVDGHRQVTDRPEGTLHGRLDPSGEAVWWFDDDRGNELGSWVVEPFAGGERRPAAPDLPPAYGTGLALARGLAVIGSSRDGQYRVHVVHDGGASRLVYQHRESAGVAGLSRDEGLVCIGHAEHGDSRHPAVRVLDLGGRTVADLWDGPGRGLWPGGWARVPGDRRLIVTHERGDMPRPLIWTPETGETEELAIDLPGEVRASWYPDGTALLIEHDHRGRSELYRLDLATHALRRLEVDPGTISGAVVRPDGEIWYAWTHSSTPPEMRAFSAGSEPPPAGLMPPGAEPDSLQKQPVEQRTIRTLLRPPGDPGPGGVAYTDHAVGSVHVFVAEPAAPRPHPTVFLIHGGPAAHDRDEFLPRVQVWVDHGYAVVLVNYRGSTGYGRAWRDALQGNPGLTELEDIASVHEWALAERLADPARCVLAGRSWGGYLTLLGLGTQPDRWSLGVAAVPVADYIAAFEDEMEPLKAFDRALFGGSPDEIPDRYRERSPITYVERVRVPVMVFAGENDPRCPIRQIENYVARLEQLGKPHEVYRYDAGHGSLVIEETIRQTEAMLAFAARHLGTAKPT